MKDRRVSIVIPNFNGQDLLAKNLPFVLEAVNFTKNQVLEVIVVDDGSTDGSVGQILKNFPKVKLIKHKVNRGFSAAVNTGVRSAKGNLVALLNSDVTPSINFLEKVLGHFADEDIFAVSLHEHGYGWSKGTFDAGFIAHSPGTEPKTTHDTFWVSGGSGVFSRELWMELGGLDEKLFSPFYWEDVDICYRAQKRGLKLLWEPEAIVAHEHESTVSKLNRKFVSRIQERNQLLLIWKNLTSTRLIRKHVVALVKRIISHIGYMRIVLMALTKLPVLLPLRSKERKQAKVSDEAIFARFK